MRIAFVDLVFAWPPPGGAQIDLYYTMRGLQALGHEVHLFGACYDFAWQFGSFDPATLPFPSTQVWFSSRSYNRRDVPTRFRREVDAWKPDVVFFGFGRWLKPYVIEALAHYPLISRYYMYEHLCPRDFCLYKEEETCPNDFLHTPNACRRCAFNCWQYEIKASKYTGYGREYRLARAYSLSYRRRFISALKKVRLAIVNNSLAKGRLEGYCREVTFIPGGVNLADFEYVPRPLKAAHEVKIILMSGRADDYRKGAYWLVSAARGLSDFRNDFEVWVTANPEEENKYKWLKYIGWQNPDGIKKVYRQADICVIPSVWEEPFGLVAIEAMAAGVPVCASRVGGLKEIVRHGETGLLFTPGCSAALALTLERMLDAPEWRARMGEAGRKRVEADHDWNTILSRYYPELLEKVLQ